jgi:F-type H+-transporting ATPase subunit epsilon
MARLKCTIVTPESTALDREAEFVALPLYDGEIGIGPLHTPLIGRLGFGEMRLHDGKHLVRFYLDGGFVQVVADTVTVLTNRAVPADQIDLSAVEEQLAEAIRRKANTPELFEIRDRLVDQARGQLRVHRRAEKETT